MSPQSSSSRRKSCIKTEAEAALGIALRFRQLGAGKESAMNSRSNLKALPYLLRRHLNLVGLFLGLLLDKPDHLVYLPFDLPQQRGASATA